MTGVMDQGVSYEAIEGLKDQKLIYVVMDRQQATDQGISKSRCDGSGSNDSSDGWSCNGSGSKGWIEDKSNERWIRKQAMDQKASKL